MVEELRMVLAFFLATAVGFFVGRTVSVRRAQSRWIRGLLRATKEAERGATAAAFARAARAVGIWPHRVTHRADLMRHLESLATAPELGDCAPNPEEALDATTAAVRPPIPSAAPVSAVDPMEGADSDDGTHVVDVYRAEGFL